MRAGESIRNNRNGETLTMLVSDQENGGACQLYEVRLPPRRPSPPLHYHVRFTETFRVVEGALDMYFGPDRRHVVLHPKESTTAHIRELHTFANDRDQPAVITVETRPAGGVVRAFQLAYGIANDGGAAKDGLPRNPLLRLLFIRISEGFLPRVPLLLQKAILGLAAFVARVTGVDRRVAKYLA
jgi:mannose-6-phosphate isomerase-like protein (cupin superfamily)